MFVVPSLLQVLDDRTYSLCYHLRTIPFSLQNAIPLESFANVPVSSGTISVLSGTVSVWNDITPTSSNTIPVLSRIVSISSDTVSVSSAIVST
jgi:hypothetical protein